MPAGFVIKGIEPIAVRSEPTEVRLLYYTWIVDLAIRAKDRDLSKGLDRFGDKMRPIVEATRRNRKSAMTPDGKGDPVAPPLTPGRKLSRTRSLLAGKAFPDRAEFFWRFDPWTGNTWDKILTYHAEAGRDVFGLAPDSMERVRLKALTMWRRWLRDGKPHPTALVGMQAVAPLTMSPIGDTRPVFQQSGRTNLRNATLGIGAGPSREALRTGNWTGGRTETELKAWARTTAPAAVQGRPAATYNRLLSAIWGNPGQGPGEDGISRALTPPGPRPNYKVIAEREAGVKFKPPEAASGKRYATVVVDVAKVDQDLARDPRYHVTPGGGGAAIGGRYANFLEFLAKAQREGKAIEQPRASLAADDGLIWISDGRHRFAAFRDRGQRLLPLSVPRDQAAAIRALYGATRDLIQWLTTGRKTESSSIGSRPS